ncbi:hypothetical protein C6499_17600 [Candidatus Poribacteria bacterium]|nr:MAG: hypothetical protein C6499_17600 [Candidatus Poribacteria bacterium]
MKKTVSSIFLTLIFFLILSQLNSFAEDSTRWRLPEGAKARLGKGSITQIAYSPNGMHLAAAGSAGIWIYDVTIHQEVALLTENTGPVSGVAFSPDGSTIVSGYASADILVWDVKTGKRKQTLPTKQEWVSSIAFSPDGKAIASGGACVEGMCPGITLLDTETGERLKSFGGAYTTLSVCFSPDGKTLASSGDEWDSNIRLWDVQTGKRLKTLKKRTAFEDFEGRDVNSVVFSPDGNVIASGSGNGTIRLWNAHTGEFIKYLEGHTKSVNSVVFSPNGNTLISTGEDGACLWDVNTGEYIEEVQVPAFSAAFSPDRKICAIGSEMGIFLQNAHTFQFLESLTRNIGSEDKFRGKDIGSIGSVAFSPDGNTIVSCGGNNIHLWDSHTNQLLKTLIGHTESVNSVVFSPDGNTIASASDDGTICLWNVRTRKRLKTLMAHADSVNSVVFNSDGETIASAGNDRTVRLWNANTGELIKTLTGHVENVNTVAFSSDGETIASGSGKLVYLGGREDSGTCVGQEIRLWNTNTGELIKTLIGHTSVVNSVVFSSDGNTIASGSGHWMGYEGKASAGEEVRLWNANTGELIKTLTGHKDVVSSVAFSPDGNLIVSGDWYDWGGHLSSGTWSGEIRVWDAHTGELLKTLTGHTGGVSSVAFSPDGKVLASGRTDGTILLWDFSTLP